MRFATIGRTQRWALAAALFVGLALASHAAPLAAHNTMTETAQPRTAPSTTGPIVLLGASYAQAWPLREVKGVPVVNRGVGGQQSFELLERFDRDVVALQPRAVILWGFINDLFRAPAGELEPTLARVRATYIEMIGRARARGIAPILTTEVTIRPRAEGWVEQLTVFAAGLLGRRGYADHINAQVQILNRWILDTAQRERLLVLQLDAQLSEPGGRRHPRYALPDGSHITTAGYGVLTSYATPLLEEFIVGRY